MHQRSGLNLTTLKKYTLLILLTICYILNFADRYLLSIALVDIKAEFALSDLQLGTLSGLAFALFYTSFGLLLARLADRYHRGVIIATATAIWSVFTLLTGFVNSYIQLLLSRIGVGIGEAGGVAPAHSLIASHFKNKERSLALSIFQTGATIGIAIASIVGAYIISLWGWRHSFMVFGFVGIVFSVGLWLLLPDNRPKNTFIKTTPLKSTIQQLWQNSVFRHICYAQILVNIFGYGMSIWLPSLLQREFGADIITSGYWTAFVSIVGTVGILLGGIVVNRLYANNPLWQFRLPTICLLLGFIPIVASFQFANINHFMPVYIVGELLVMMHLGVGMSIIQNVVKSEQRSQAAAICLFLLNFFGLAIAPSIYGFASDLLTANSVTNPLTIVLAMSASTILLGAYFYFRAGRFFNNNQKQYH